MLYYPDFQRYHPLRAPDWRWDRACKLFGRNARLSRRRDDELTCRAAKYLRALGGTDCPAEPVDRLIRSFPDLHAAHLLHGHGGTLREEIEARLLARQTSDEISTAISMSFDAATIDAYESYFFAVRDRFQATDWVTAKLLHGGALCGFADMGTLWRAIGYWGGAHALDVAIAVSTDAPLPGWLDEFFADDEQYKKASFRLRCKTSFAVMMSGLDKQLRGLVEVNQRHRRLDRRAMGKTDKRKSLIPTMENFLKSVVRRKRPSRLTALRRKICDPEGVKATCKLTAPRERSYDLIQGGDHGR